jgi:tight adherence protein C
VALKAVVAAAVSGLALAFFPIGLAPVAGAGGFFIPDVFLDRLARRRRHRADQSVPEFLDLLATGSAAGLTVPLALRRAAEALEGPLAIELQGLIWAADHGARWREEFSVLAGRLGLPELKRAAAVVGRAERLGAPLSDALRDLAAEVRDSRRARAADRARTAPVRMLFPLVFLILPAFLLLTVVPVLLATLRSIR